MGEDIWKEEKRREEELKGGGREGEREVGKEGEGEGKRGSERERKRDMMTYLRRIKGCPKVTTSPKSTIRLLS